MAQWGKTDNNTNSVSWGASSLSVGSGRTAKAANNQALYNNVAVGSFVPKMVVGQFGASAAERANTTTEGKKIQAVGWQLRRAGMGPVLTLTASAGTSFANGETVTLSNGSVNAIATLTSNATQNLASAVITGAGGVFVNAASVAVAFNRQKHVVNLNVSGGTAYTNTDTIRVSNAVVNATATISTNSTGGFANGGITLTNVGLFANTEANTDVVITVLAANGAASNGSGATLTANLGTSSSGTVAAATLGGRAGRVTYECLVALPSLSNGASDDSYLPT